MNQQNGIGFVGLLALVLIGLKLAGIGVVADWSWWWVLSPFWVPLALFAALVACMWAVYAVRNVWGRK